MVENNKVCDKKVVGLTPYYLEYPTHLKKANQKLGCMVYSHIHIGDTAVFCYMMIAYCLSIPK
jgi:hypothetical protein